MAVRRPQGHPGIPYSNRDRVAGLRADDGWDRMRENRRVQSSCFVESTAVDSRQVLILDPIFQGWRYFGPFGEVVPPIDEDPVGPLGQRLLPSFSIGPSVVSTLE